MRQQFRSIKGMWNGLTVIYLVALLGIGIAESFLLSPLIALITVVPMLFVIVQLQERYELNDRELIIYSGGQVRLRLSAGAIQKVQEDGKGLRIWYSEKDYIRVYPKERAAFEAKLRQLNPNLP